MKEKTYNYFIDFLKFIFSICIVINHAILFPTPIKHVIFPYITVAVEFYFIVTGYLMMNSIEKEENKQYETIGVSTFNFLKKKIKRWLPYLLFSFIIGIYLSYGIEGFYFQNLFCDNIVSEISLTSILGYRTYTNGTWWYLSTIIIVMMIFYPIAKKTKQNFTYLIAPITIFLILALINYKSIDLEYIEGNSLIFYNGIYRGIIFILLGCICFELSKNLKNKKMRNYQKCLITIFEIAVYIILIYDMNKGNFQFLIRSILLTNNVAITFSNQSYMSKIFRNSIWQKLGHFGFILFLSHMSVINFINRKINLPYINTMIIYITLSILIAFVQYILIDIVLVKLSNKYNKTKKIELH